MEMIWKMKIYNSFIIVNFTERTKNYSQNTENLEEKWRSHKKLKSPSENFLAILRVGSIIPSRCYVVNCFFPTL